MIFGVLAPSLLGYVIISLSLQKVILFIFGYVYCNIDLNMQIFFIFHKIIQTQFSFSIKIFFQISHEYNNNKKNLFLNIYLNLGPSFNALFTILLSIMDVLKENIDTSQTLYIFFLSLSLFLNDYGVKLLSFLYTLSIGFLHKLFSTKHFFNAMGRGCRVLPTRVSFCYFILQCALLLQ